MRYEHLNEEELRNLAKERVELKNGMMTHGIIFLAVNLFLTVLYNMTTPGGYPWMFWVYFGWGLGLAIHYVYAIYRLTHDGNARVDSEVQRMLKK